MSAYACHWRGWFIPAAVEGRLDTIRTWPAGLRVAAAVFRWPYEHAGRWALSQSIAMRATVAEG